MKSVLLLLTFILSSIGCKTQKQTYGGTTQPSTIVSSDDTAIARGLIASSVLKLQFNPSSAVITSGKISQLTNLKLPADTTTAHLYNLLPNDSQFASINSGWIELSPTTSSTNLMGSVQQDMNFSELTFVAVLRGDSEGDFLSFDPLDRGNQAFSLIVDAGTLRARFWSSPSDYYDSSAALISSQPNIIVAGFGADVGIVQLSVNGGLTTVATNTGSPGAPFTLSRFFSLGSSTSGKKSYLKDVYVFGRLLSKYEMGSMINYVAKANNISGLTIHPDLKAPSSGGPGADPNFAPAKAVLQANCVSCHASWGSSSASYFKNIGLVTKGNAEGSALYYRIKNSTGAGGPKNMPQSGNISSGDADLIKKWINEMN